VEAPSSARGRRHELDLMRELVAAARGVSPAREESYLIVDKVLAAAARPG